jgi:hypothetical protein
MPSARSSSDTVMRVRRLGLGAMIVMAACGRTGFDLIDAAPGGATDAARIVPPVLVASVSTRTTGTSSLSFLLTVPPGADRFLIVSAAIGSKCGDPSVATVTGVTYAGVPLKPIDAVTGTPCDAKVTRSEQWQLVAPAMGTNEVVVTLSAPGLTLHGGALVFTGSNQVTPVRASITGRGASTEASVVVPSAIGDLVVSTVGQGDEIASPGLGQTPVILLNASGANTLDNSASSTAPGAAPVVAMDWHFELSDEWQMIVCSLQPP